MLPRDFHPAFDEGERNKTLIYPNVTITKDFFTRSRNTRSTLGIVPYANGNYVAFFSTNREELVFWTFIDENRIISSD